MMNRKSITILIVLFSSLLFASPICGQQQACEQTMEESLKNIATVLNKSESKELWGISLDASIIIIDPFSNTMFFTKIKDGLIEPIEEKQWNNQVPLANSFFDYEGERYVTIIHPALMNASCEQRTNLLAHEIFHLHQNSLGIKNTLSANFHMDEVKGRALLRIEMKALQEVLEGSINSLNDALIVRAYRQKLYPNNNEDMYELNEGLAEYTGVRLSIPSVKEYLAGRLNYNISRGYSNAFGYFTGATYAIILDDIYPLWKSDEDINKGLVYLIKKAKPEYEYNFTEKDLESLFKKYSHEKLILEEERELESFGDISVFKELLKPEAAKLSITNNKINFTYNPHDRIITLDDAVLLRNMTISGEWGQLKVKNSIVRLNNWSAFYLLPPKEMTNDTAIGDDYEVRINAGWIIIKDGEVYKIVSELDN